MLREGRTWNQVGRIGIALGVAALALSSHLSSDSVLISLAIWFHALTIDADDGTI